MSRFTVSAETEEFKTLAWNRLLQKQLAALLQGAARAFALTVASNIPVRTGFLRGSLGTLEQALNDNGTPTVLPPIVPRFNNRREHYRHTKGGTPLLKTTRSGKKFTTPPNKVFIGAKLNRGGVVSSGSDFSTNGIFTFNFSDTIKYLDINDVKEGWRSWERGIAAFDAYVQANFTNAVPNLIQFTARKRIILNGTTIRETKAVL